MDTRPSPVQAESEQRGTRQESTGSERSESDLFSGSAKKSETDQTLGTFTVASVNMHVAFSTHRTGLRFSYFKLLHTRCSGLVHSSALC